MGATAGAIAAVTAGLVSGYSAYKERQTAKHQQTLQRNAIREQEEEEKKRRRALVDAQRAQLSGDGTGTRWYSSSGISANISGSKLG